MQVLWYDPADRIVSHTELARGNVHLRTWNAEFFIVLSPDHGCRISGGSYPSPTKPKSLGIKKKKKRQVGCSANSPGHSHAYSILENHWSGVSNMGSGATVTSKVLPCKSQSLLFIMEWRMEGRPWLFDLWESPGWYAGLVRGASARCSLETTEEFSVPETD